MSHYYLGIDVGTGSARAGVFDAYGRLAGTAARKVSLFRGADGVVEQSSSEIWGAVSAASQEAIGKAGVPVEAVRGVGFDATCSLVVVGPDGAPLAVGPGDELERNIIVWMDHRAVDQARRINATGHAVLDYVGGRISPEMETPKLLWLLENRPEAFDAAWQFFDLADYLTWRATASVARSTCTVTCKWTYLGHERRWDESYFRTIGLGRLADEGFERIGTQILDPGTALGQGLTTAAADDLGLLAGTPVGAGLIDAHAGGIGTVGARGAGSAADTMAYVFGTSSCTMTTTDEPVFVPGVWGPYYSAMVPGVWLNEGGQSAAGAAIEQLLRLHPAKAEAARYADQVGMSLPDWLGAEAIRLSEGASEVALLAGGRHVVPDFLGNRAPFADPQTRAVIAGLGMEDDVDDLVGFYVAGLCGLGYGLRQIIEAQTAAGATCRRIVVSGGAARSDLVRQILADTSGVEIVAPGTEEPVLLGSAILGAVAAGAFDDIPAAMAAMSRFADCYTPASDKLRAWHDRRFDLHVRFQELAREAAKGA